MGRLIAFILGGAALALYTPQFFLGEEQYTQYQDWWRGILVDGWYDKVFQQGPGIFAGLALILLAIRGKD